MQTAYGPKHERTFLDNYRAVLSVAALILLSFGAQAQIIQYPNPGSFGTGLHRLVPDSVLYVPTGCGVPVGKASLNSYGFSGNGQKIKQAAIYADTCGMHIYWYHPNDSSWSRIDTGGGGGGADSAVLSGFLTKRQVVGTNIIIYGDSAGIHALAPFLSDSTLKYVTPTQLAAKQNTVSLTTVGSSGASTFNPATGALNIPNYAGSGGTDTATISGLWITITRSGNQLTIKGDSASMASYFLRRSDSNLYVTMKRLNDSLAVPDSIRIYRIAGKDSVYMDIVHNGVTTTVFQFRDSIGTGGGSSTYAALTDVLLTSLATNQIMQWNGTKWVNITPTSALVGLGNVPNVDATNAANITSGTLPAARIGANSIDMATKMTGTLQATQEPAHTGDVTNTAGSLALTIAANAVTLGKQATGTANRLQGWDGSGNAAGVIVDAPLQVIGGHLKDTSTSTGGGGLSQIFAKNPLLTTIGTVNGTDTLVFDGNFFMKMWNVKTYGAVGDGVTDDTRKVQNTVDTAAAHGGGVVYLPPNIYVFADSFQTVRGNCQVCIPTQNVFSGAATKIVVAGGFNNHLSIGGYTTSLIPELTTGTIIKSTRAASGTYPSVFGTTNAPGYNFNFTDVEINDIVVQTYTNHGTLPAKVSAFNFLNSDKVNFHRDAAGLDTIPQASVDPSTSEAMGFGVSRYQNTGPNMVSECLAAGYKYGYVVGEHTQMDHDFAWCDKYAYTFGLGAYPITGKVLYHGCQWGIYEIKSQIFGLVNPGFNQVTNLSVEAEHNFKGYWFDYVGDINDTLNNLGGNIQISPSDSTGGSGFIYYCGGAGSPRLNINNVGHDTTFLHSTFVFRSFPNGRIPFMNLNSAMVNDINFNFNVAGTKSLGIGIATALAKLHVGGAASTNGQAEFQDITHFGDSAAAAITGYGSDNVKTWGLGNIKIAGLVDPDLEFFNNRSTGGYNFYNSAATSLFKISSAGAIRASGLAGSGSGPVYTDNSGNLTVGTGTSGGATPPGGVGTIPMTGTNTSTFSDFGLHVDSALRVISYNTNTTNYTAFLLRPITGVGAGGSLVGLKNNAADSGVIKYLSNTGNSGFFGNSTLFIRNTASGAQVNFCTNSGPMQFSHNVGTTVDFQIFSGGNAGIATTTDNAAFLQVGANTTTNAALFLNGSAADVTSPTNGMLRYITTGTHHLYFRDAGADVDLLVGGGSSQPFSDATAIMKNSSDATKLLKFDLSGLTTATTRTWIFPDVNGTVARKDAAQTFTGVQTFSSSPVVPTATAGDNSTNAASTAYVDGLVSSANYTSTWTNTTNVSSSSFGVASYIKVGNIVFVTLNGTMTHTTNSINTVLTFTLPVTTATTSQSYCGSATFEANSGLTYDKGLVSVVSGTTGQVQITPSSTGGGPINITLQYKLN